jgi:hypothetical protein
MGGSGKSGGAAAKKVARKFVATAHSVSNISNNTYQIKPASKREFE